MNLRSWMMRLLVCAALMHNFAAAETAPDASKPSPYKWLTEEQIHDLYTSVPAPPVPGSAADQADLTAVVEAQKMRTPAIDAECRSDEHFSELLFQAVYGTDRTPENSPKLYRLMKNVLAASAAVNRPAKDKYQRPRPYQGHPGEVHPLFEVKEYSYPSGHSMASFTLATVLGAAFPGKQQALLDRAAQIAQSRVDAGVHYPSDIKEGEILGKATAAVILASPAFQADLAEVAAELKP